MFKPDNDPVRSKNSNTSLESTRLVQGGRCGSMTAGTEVPPLVAGADASQQPALLRDATRNYRRIDERP